jgi:predicted O-methyltransferase YrrM
MKKIEGLKMTPIRSDSAGAASKFEDGSVDFVWIDAGHEYEEVKADIEAWMPKLKRGGVMGGDDYPFDGVSKAVKELLPKHEVGSETGWKWWRVRKV